MSTIHSQVPQVCHSPLAAACPEGSPAVLPPKVAELLEKGIAAPETSLASSATAVAGTTSGWVGGSLGISGVLATAPSKATSAASFCALGASKAVEVISVSSARAGATGTIPVTSTSAIAHLKNRIPKRSTIFIAAPIERYLDSLFHMARRICCATFLGRANEKPLFSILVASTKQGASLCSAWSITAGWSKALAAVFTWHCSLIADKCVHCAQDANGAPMAHMLPRGGL